MPADICNTSRVNLAYALTHLHALIVAWIGSNADALHRVLDAAVSLIGRTRDKIRPGRSFERKHRVGGAQRPRRAYR